MFYQFYKHNQHKCSFELFKASKRLRESKEEIKSLLSLIPGGLLVLTQDYRIAHHSQNVFRFFDTTQSNLIDTLDGDFTVQKIEYCPVDIMDECFYIFKYHIYNKKLQFKKRTDPNLPRTIFTDPIRLKQIIINLVSNAKKFTLKGSIELYMVETFSGN